MSSVRRESAARTAIIKGRSGEGQTRPPRLTPMPPRAYAPRHMNPVVISRKRMTAKKATPPCGGRWSVL